MSQSPLKLAWAPTQGGLIPPNAVVGGNDASSNEELFIGRTVYERHLLPGKVLRSHGCLYVAFAGTEISFNDYEILISDSHGCLQWIAQDGGEYPENAVKGGFEEDAPLYVARTKAPDGGLCIGVLHPDHKVCYYSWGGQEHKSNEYEVLTCT